MKTSTKRIVFMLLSITFLMVSVAIYSLLIKPAYGIVVDYKSRLTQQTQMFEKYEKALSGVEGLFTELESAGQTRQQISLIFPASKDSAYFASQIIGLTGINALALENFSTKITTVQTKPSGIIKNVGRLSGTVKGTGSYAGIKTFLRQLERNILLVDVEELKIGKSSDSEQPGLSFQLSAVTYYQVE